MYACTVVVSRSHWGLHIQAPTLTTKQLMFFFSFRFPVYYIAACRVILALSEPPAAQATNRNRQHSLQSHILHRSISPAFHTYPPFVVLSAGKNPGGGALWGPYKKRILKFPITPFISIQVNKSL